MDKNLEVYNSKQVLQWYIQLGTILPVEKKIFESFSAILSRGHLLDIGIGGGRTTAYLLPLCKNYTGIDYSRGFINTVKSKYPAATCLVMDARDLSDFKTNQFDFVNFSFNGMDYVDLEGRKKILSEVNRVLTPNGHFFFSTHNREHSTFNLSPWLNKENTLFTNIKTFLKLAPFFFRKVRQKKHEHFTKEYALINDSAHNYSLMTFYTTPEYLRTQLAEAGFGEIKFYTKTGATAEGSGLGDWIFATGKKIIA